MLGAHGADGAGARDLEVLRLRLQLRVALAVQVILTPPGMDLFILYRGSLMQYTG